MGSQVIHTKQGGHLHLLVHQEQLYQLLWKLSDSKADFQTKSEF